MKNKNLISLIALSLIFICSTPGVAYVLRYTDGGDTVRWHGSCFYYSVQQSGSDDIAFEDLAVLVRQSFEPWENVDCSYFYFHETAPASVDRKEANVDKGNVNLIVWRETPETWTWGNNSSIIAMTSVNFDPTTGEIIDADIEFNGAHNQFGTLVAGGDNPSGVIDLENTLVHEIGHCIGLEHTDVKDATMHAYTSENEIDKRTLDKDDIDGLCALYPLGQDPAVCEEPYCGLDLSGISTQCNLNTPSDDSGCRMTPLREAGRSWLIDVIRLVGN